MRKGTVRSRLWTTAVAALAVVGGLTMAATANAGGLYIYEYGGPSMGTASAGRTARARDASTAIHNPAGMTRLDDHQLMLAVAPGYGSIEFEPADDTPVPGKGGGNQGGFVPVMSGSYVHKISDRWRFGVGLLSVSGAILDPDNRWVGRNQVTNLSLFTISALPSIAYRVNDWLSVGAGALLTYGKLDWDLQAPTNLGKIKIDDADDFEPAAVASLQLEPTNDLRIGFVYHSKVDLKLDGDIKLPVGVQASLGLGIPLVQNARIGLYWQASDRLAWLAGVGWEDWSDMSKIPVSVERGSVSISSGFKDTWSGSAGMHFRLTDVWLFQFGLRYDTSVVDKKDRIAALPIDRQIRIGTGLIYDYSPHTQMSFSFTYVNLGDSDLDNASVKGKYDPNSLFFAGFSVNWKKLPWSGKATL